MTDKLTDEDKQRIEQKIKEITDDYSDNLYGYLSKELFRIAEYATLYERQELVEAIRARYEHLKWMKDLNTTKPETIAFELLRNQIVTLKITLGNALTQIEFMNDMNPCESAAEAIKSIEEILYPRMKI